ncbi:hypothetical protein MferCBS31731_002174 [Microsporum ferrugineum]
MSSTAIQLNFSLRTSSNVKTVHLLGSWDNYAGQLPLSASKSKAGSWQGAFRFQTTMLHPGSRYWYYYIMDGYHVSHDPAAEFTVEPTTGRKLNILDVPRVSSTKSAPTSKPRRDSVDVPVGRALSPSRILHPRPSKPYASRQIREANYQDLPTVDALTARFRNTNLSDDDSDISSSPPSSSGSSLSSRSNNTSPSSVSSFSDLDSACSCQRFGITRSGEKVKIDCGGRRCGYNSLSDSSDDSDEACSSDEEYKHVRTQLRRQNITVRR